MSGRTSRRAAALALLASLLACREGERSPTEPSAAPATDSSTSRRPPVRRIGTRPPVPTPIITPSRSYVIRGRVTDASTGLAIAHADVRLIEFSFGAHLRAEQNTDSAGEFFFSTDYCDTCFLLAGHPDYYGPAQAFAGTREPITVVNFQLAHL